MHETIRDVGDHRKDEFKWISAIQCFVCYNLLL